MKLSRRSFLKNSGLVGIALPLFPGNLFSEDMKSQKFLRKIGICTSISSSRILVSAGYSYLEEGVGNFLVPREAEAVFNEKLILLKSSGIPVEACNSFLPGDLKAVGPETHHEKIIEYCETAFRRASQAGIKTIVFGSSGSRGIPEGFPREDAKQQFISLAKLIGPVAQKYDVVISLEPLNTKECNFINSVAEGGEIVMSVNHPNFRLLADIYHMKMEDESPENIIKYGDLLFHVHIAEKEGRAAPGVHGEDFSPYLQALKEVGYKGRMSIECRWENLEVQAKDSLLVLQKQIRDLNS